MNNAQHQCDITTTHHKKYPVMRAYLVKKQQTVVVREFKIMFLKGYHINLYSPLSRYLTKDSFEMLVSKLAMSGAMYCVAASQLWTYSPVYKKPPVAIVTFFTKCP